MITLYRTVSTAEKLDFDTNGQFRTGRNTLEVKQFFKSEESVQEYLKEARKKKYSPEYNYLLIVNVAITCLEKIPYLEQLLDGFDAITIYKRD